MFKVCSDLSIEISRHYESSTFRYQLYNFMHLGVCFKNFLILTCMMFKGCGFASILREMAQFIKKLFKNSLGIS